MTRAPAPLQSFASAAGAARPGAFFLAFLVLSGCAAPGEPTPRHPVIPIAVTDLSARQSGNGVALEFALPTRSTDREPLPEMPGVEIDRAVLPPGGVPTRDTMWRQIYTVPSGGLDSYVSAGRFDFRDVLSQDDVSRAPGSVFAYRVRTRASKSRASQNSNVVSVALYPAPPAPQDVNAMVTETAIVLSWMEPTPAAGLTVAGFRVYRALSNPPPEEAKRNSAPELIGTSPTLEFRDMQFAFGETYVYTVRAIVQYGIITVESEDSSSVIVEARDTFPPGVPTGLEAAIIPATNQGPLRVELSWAISSELDLAGYRVYRSESAESVGERLGGELLSTPAFRDDSVKPGGHYFYRVSAVDQAGNESAPSTAIAVDVP